jgi:hypothetical protein
VAEYQRHEPEKALLHQVVREQLEGFLASAAHREQPTPRFVEQELRAFLRCGVLAHGFLRVHCDACGHDRLVAFSCYLERETIRSRAQESIDSRALSRVLLRIVSDRRARR